MQRSRADLNYEQVYIDAKSRGAEERLEEELNSFYRLIRAHYDFKLFLEDPRIAGEYKKKRLQEICPKEMSADFFGIIFRLIDNGREELIEELSRNITKKLSKEKRILFGQVTAACAVPGNLRERLLKIMEKIKGEKVRLRYDEDGSLLGGLRVKFITGEIWDVSLKHKLDDLKVFMLN